MAPSSSTFRMSSVLQICDLKEGVGEVQTKLAEDFTLVLASTTFQHDYVQVFNDLPALCEELPVDNNFRPTLGSCVVVYTCDVWQRGCVISVLDDCSYRISLYDSCSVQTASAKNIRKCPEQFLGISYFGVRASLNESLTLSQEESIKPGICFRFEIVHNDGETATAILKSKNIRAGTITCSVTLSPWVPILEAKGLRCIKLQNKCESLIVSYHNQNDIYLSPLDDVSYELRNSVLQDVVAYCEEAPDMERLPDPGELVACRFTSDEIYYRAQVISSKRGRIQVIYVDFGNTEYVTLDRLKPLTDYFKQIPCTAVHVSLKGVRQGPLTVSAIHFLDLVIISDSKVIVNFTDSYTKGVTFTSESNENISAVIDDHLTPKWQVYLDAGYDPLAWAPVTVDHDIHFTDLPEKEKFNLFILNKYSCRNFHGCAIDDTSIYILKGLPKEMANYCNRVPMDCYTPRINELCLAKYGDEWLRAVCLHVKPIGCAVYFIDWGNTEIVSPSFIRKMPKDFAEFPALANYCDISGLAESISDDTQEWLEEAMPVYSIHTVTVNHRIGDVFYLDMPIVAKLPENTVALF